MRVLITDEDPVHNQELINSCDVVVVWSQDRQEYVPIKSRETIIPRQTGELPFAFLHGRLAIRIGAIFEGKSK